MDTKEMHGHEGCEMCGRGMGMKCCGRGHWVHIIVKILVAVFIFWCGVQFGELKGALHDRYPQQYGNYGYGMMGGWTQRALQ